MSMDPWLAQFYGTGGSEDLEKRAQTEMLHQLAAEDEVDLSGLSDEELMAMADSSQEEEYVDEDALEAASQQQLLQKEAEAKFEEADFLGRVMAHAYTQELQKIAGVGESARSAGNFIKNKAQAVGGYLKGKAQSAGGYVKGKGQTVGSHLNANRRTYGEVGGGAALAGGGYALGRKSGHGVKGNYDENTDSWSKEASAFNKLAMMKAAEMLEGAGVDPATGQELPGGPQGPMAPQQAPQQGGVSQQAVMQEMQRRQQMAQAGSQGQPGQQMGQPGGQPGQEGQPGGEEAQLEEMVNNRALEMLQQAGYDPSAVIQALQGGGQQGQPQQ